MTKLNKLLLLSASILFIVGCSAEPASVEKVDAEAAPVVSAEMMTPVETAEKITKADWGQCRDACYNARAKCFEVGENTESCEQLYDDCVGRCDANH